MTCQHQKYMRAKLPPRNLIVPDITRDKKCPYNYDNVRAFCFCSLWCVSQLYCLYKVVKKYIYIIWNYKKRSCNLSCFKKCHKK